MKVLLGAILVLLVGCSGVVQAQGEDMDAQIANLTERVEELESENASLWEVIATMGRDPVRQQLHLRFALQEFDEEAPALVRLYFPDLSGTAFDLNVEYVQAYAPSYLALACLEGVEPTPQYFRDAIGKTGSNSPGDISDRVIRLMVDEFQRLEREVEDPSMCLRPYLSPWSMADAKVAMDMVTRVGGSNLPSRFKGGVQNFTIHVASAWFDKSDRQMPFICWMSGGNDGDLEGDPCGLPTEDESPEG
jgi:hypothetical protein